MKERKGLTRWIKEHKKELIIAGISVGALLLLILGIKNRAAIKALWASLRKEVKHPATKVAETAKKIAVEAPQETIKEVASAIVSNTDSLKVSEAIKNVTAEIPQEPINEVVTVASIKSYSVPFEVRRHIRTLHDGWHASPKKIAEAAKHNIILLDGQTWVDAYTKGDIVA